MHKSLRLPGIPAWTFCGQDRSQYSDHGCNYMDLDYLWIKERQHFASPARAHRAGDSSFTSALRTEASGWIDVFTKERMFTET
jgi:hypothetical protein